MNPSDLVLRTMRLQPERWSLVPHRNDAPDITRLAVEIVERLLPARFAAQPTIAGRQLPPDEFPLTMSFIVKAAAVLGKKLGQKRAYQVRREALTILRQSGKWQRRGRYGFELFRARADQNIRNTPNTRTTPLQPPRPETLCRQNPGCQVPIYQGRELIRPRNASVAASEQAATP